VSSLRSKNQGMSKFIRLLYRAAVRVRPFYDFCAIALPILQCCVPFSFAVLASGYRSSRCRYFGHSCIIASQPCFRVRTRFHPPPFADVHIATADSSGRCAVSSKQYSTCVCPPVQLWAFWAEYLARDIKPDKHYKVGS
jgi:hypothetical protein